MPLTADERAARRESRRSQREKERRQSAGSLRNNLQGYQTESARLFGLSIQSSNDSSNIFSNDSSNLVNSSNDSNNLDSSYNSATNKRRPVINRNLSGIEEGLDCSAEDYIMSGSMHNMQPPGQDAAQGASPRHHRVGPFDKDSDDDNYYDEEEGENNTGGLSTNPFLDDSLDDRASSPEREFQPAKLDRSGRSGKSNRSGRTSEGGVGESFDADDDAPSKTRPATLVASALTTSSAATQKVANTDEEGNNRKTARDKFMEVLQDDDGEDDRGETVEDYGSPFHNTGPSPFDDDSVDQGSQGSYEQPRAYRPFSGGSQSSVVSGDVSGEHYASMQELLEEERSRSIVSHKTSRFGGCVERVLGGKRTKQRKITLLVIVLLLCAIIGVSVYSIVLGRGKGGDGDGKKGSVDSQKVKPIERPETSFVPVKSGNASSADSTFGMADNSTDDLLGFEPTFPSEGVTSDATTPSTSPTSSPVRASTIAPTPVSSEMIIPAGFEPTPPPSDFPTPTVSEFILSESLSVTSQPTDFSTTVEMTIEPTEVPTAAQTTFQPIGFPSAAPYVSITTDAPISAAPVLLPTNPPIAASVPSVQTDISGLLTFSEPVPQDTEDDLIIFLDALKKSIRSEVSSSLQATDELVYVDIISINGVAVDSLLSRRRFIRRRLQVGSLIEYEIVVLTDCNSPDCTNADTVASDVFSRTTNEISSSVFSGAFASTLEVNVLSSSGGSVEYLSGVELGDFSEPKVTVLTPTGGNETSSTNSTAPVDVIAANETDPIDSSTTGSNTAIFDTCEFCEDGMPDPLKVVSTTGLTCIQLKEAVSDKDSESSTCMTVKQAEGLCCAVSTTASDTIGETSMNATIDSDETDVDVGEGNATFTGNETIVTNSTYEELDGINVTETSSMNTTIGVNETILTNITSGNYLSDRNETTTTNSTTDGYDFNIIDTVVGNETFVSFDDMPIMYENGTDSGFVDDALWPDLFCPDTLMRSIEIDVFASLFYEVVPSSSIEARNGIFCARLQVKSLGWIGFALSKDGSMIGSEAIIAQPYDNTVLKYSLLGKSPDLISKVDGNHQTLRGTSVTQDLELGVTTMEFVKHLEEFEEIPILTRGLNHFLYARGGSNLLGYHLGRMTFMKDFAEDVVAVVDDDLSVDLSDSNETMTTNSTSADVVDASASFNITDVEDGVDGTNSTVSTSAPPVSTCTFCNNGMPEPFKVVSDSGLTCNQLKEAVADKDSDSNTCLALKQGEGLCCELSPIVSVTNDDTSVTNSTMDSDETFSTNSTSGNSDSLDAVVTNETDAYAPVSSPITSTLVVNETTVMTNSTSAFEGTEVGNATEVVYDDTPVNDLINPEPFLNSTLVGNETLMTTNSTDGDFDFNIIIDTIGNETFVTYGDGHMTDKNGTDSDFDSSDSNYTTTTNSTTDGYDFNIIDTVVGNETFVSFDDMPIMYENGTDSGFVDDALWPDLFCPDTLMRSIEIDVFASLFYEVVPSSSIEARNGIFCARLQVKSLGWIGFALSKDGSMIGSEAIIAQPYDNTVLKYSLLGKSPDLISKVDGNHQTLRGTSVTQDLELGVTTMEFVKHLEEFEEIPILTRGLNHFLYARGGSNLLGYHLGRMSFMKDFADDVVAVVDDDVSVDLSDSNETMTTNSTTDGYDFNLIDTVVGNETFVSFDDMPIMYENGTDSGFVDDALWPDLFCPDTLMRSIEIDVFASLFYEVVPSSSIEARNGIFCARLQVKSLGWIGFALSKDGSMIGSEAIIAQPYDNTVLKYSLLGKSPDLISKVDGNHQTLRGTSVTQDLELGVTTMEFVKHLEEFEEIPILTRGLNHFLYARGGSNLLGYHLGRMSFMKDFAEDVVAVVDDDVSVDLSDSNETMTTNSTSGGFDFNIIDIVVGNETFVSFDDMPIMYENGTDSGFENDALYSDDNSTLNDNDGTPTSDSFAGASEDTPDPGDMNSTLDDFSGTTVDATDVSDPSAILNALSFPYTLSHELGSTSAAARFGFSVSMSSNGHILAVGAKDMADAVLGEEVGAVLLYSMETSPPTLLQTMINQYPDGEFGNSVGLSNDGSRLVVGARSENDQAGVVRVYGRDSFGQWAILGMPINGLSSGERAGWSVSISGDGSSVAVGAPKGGGSASGSVVTYRFDNESSWEPYGSVLEGVSKEAFGYTTSLSYDGDLVAVGSPKAMSPEGASNAGRASVFYLYGTEWLPLPAKEIHGISANDIEGTSIALSQDGSILVVGGKGRDNDDGVSNVGHCRIYEFGTEWELLHSMEGETENERLGSSVAVAKNSNVVACGGEAAMYDGVGIGVVRVWNRGTSQSSVVWPRTSDGGALFGSSLSLKEDGKVLAVGAPERISMTVGSKAGAVDIYGDFII